MISENGIDAGKVPAHIAVIMDGNGRWAKKQGLMRVFGHKKGVESVRSTIETCRKLGVKYLTLYAFSEENWLRPKAEVDGPYGSFGEQSESRIAYVCQKRDKTLNSIGDVTRLPDGAARQLEYCREQTASCSDMVLTLALSYSAQTEIEQCVAAIAADVAEGRLKVGDIDKNTIEKHLYTSGMPAVDLLIRTSGEQRVSNFLLWQIAYAEFYFTPVLWPDFSEKDLLDAVRWYAGRERRFGLTSEQLTEQRITRL